MRRPVRERFEGHYLASTLHRERVAIAEAMYRERVAIVEAFLTGDDIGEQK
jgi:hypothetical protein